MFSGDAPRCTATMSVIRDRTRSKAGDLFAYFSDPYGFMRTIVLSLADIAYERRAARRQRRSGAEHVDRGGLYPLIRAAIAVVMRDLVTALLMADIVEGVPVSYATFVGYDEVAHHSGIREPDALAVLKRHDRQLARLERATAQSPRPYHLVVLSDHGQTQGAPFRQRYGETLEEVVRGALGPGRRIRAGGGRRGLGRRRRRAGRRAPGARASEDVCWHAPHAADRSRARSRLGPTARRSSSASATGRGGRRRRRVVMVSGGLGLIYLPLESASGSRSSRSTRRIRACWTPSPPIPGSDS